MLTTLYASGNCEQELAGGQSSVHASKDYWLGKVWDGKKISREVFAIMNGEACESLAVLPSITTKLCCVQKVSNMFKVKYIPLIAKK